MESEISAWAAFPNRGDSARRHPLGLETCWTEKLNLRDPIEIVERTVSHIAAEYHRATKNAVRCNFGLNDIILDHCVACFVGEEEIWNKYPAFYGGSSALRFADLMDQASRLRTFVENPLSLFDPVTTFRSEWEVRLFFEWDREFARKGAGAEQTFCLIIESYTDRSEHALSKSPESGVMFTGKR